jgi:hypothetical protein
MESVRTVLMQSASMGGVGMWRKIDGRKPWRFAVGTAPGATDSSPVLGALVSVW